MGEMRGFMERVAQVVTRQEHDLHHALPRVLGVVEGRLAGGEGATRQMAEAAGNLSARLDEQAQRIIELAREAQNLRQVLADSVLNWGQQLATRGGELQAMRDCLDARIDALGRELAALRVAVQNGQMAVAQAAGQPPEERAFREGQMAEIATLKQQMATLA